jgi:multicomponent Na+:H+ antiporter subunit E
MLIGAKRFGLFALAWLALTGADPSGFVPGAVAAAAAAAVSLRLLPAGGPVRLLGLLALLPGFLWRSLVGGIDVALRALHPDLPLRPAWIAYPLRLPPGGPRVSLGSEISLLPGTLAAGSEGDRLLVHCLDSEQPILEQIAEEEERIAACLGTPLTGARDA